MPISRRLLDVLVCPICKKKLRSVETSRALHCRHCRLRFPVRRGVPVMDPRKARPSN